MVRLPGLHTVSSVAGTFLWAIVPFLLLPPVLTATSASSATSSSLQIEDGSRVPLKGHVHPLIRSAQDLGGIDASQKLSLSLVFAPSPSQQAALQKLLQDQQDPTSAQYHKWITPEQYADAYGLSAAQVETVRSWLTSAGIAVREVAPSRNRISFDATAAQAQSLFNVEIRRYNVNGELHYANSTEPSVPEALSGLVVGIRGLSDFRLKARSVRSRRQIPASLNPHFTSSISGDHFLGPDDFATIYDVKALYSSGIDGTGQKLAVAGQTDIKLSDIEAFRSASGLAPNDPQIVVDGADPGTHTDDLTEADLDLEWSGAVAKGATIIYVNSSNVINSFDYAITNNLAPVLAISYGNCEADSTTSDVQAMSTMAQQANAQGITITASSGDDGAADCESATSTTATTGLSVDVPASIPYVTGVGGTEFVEGSNASQYWSTTNDSANGSALSYIPEEAWNDTAADKMLSAGGGGASTIFTKPSWQTGKGVPSDGQRDVPDVSLSASPDHDGFLICSNGSCVTGFRDASNNLTVVGGTSTGSPSFAGIVALLNQKTGSAGQGNINPTLYALATSSPSAFHDVTSGNNIVPCTAGSKDCTNGSLGYSTGAGYDQVTGLGSIDTFNLASDWQSSGTTAAPADFQLTASPTAVTISGTASGSSKLTIAPVNSFSGPVTLSCVVPTAITCSISPGTVTGSGSTTVMFGVVSAALRQGSDSRWSVFVLPGMGRGFGTGMLAASFCFVILVFLAWSARRGSELRTRMIMGVCAVLFVGMIVGCGGGGGSSTKTVTTTPTPVAYTAQITAQSGSLTHTTSIQVTVE
jgi:subtilase family serine protease